jgi:hypothetical protein
MNRTVIIVKDPKPVSGYRYALITLHWQYGPSVEIWLQDTYPDWRLAWPLIEAGHRSTIEEPRRIILPEHQNFRTLREAKAYCEYLTLAYYDGKRWRFEHEPQGV